MSFCRHYFEIELVDSALADYCMEQQKLVSILFFLDLSWRISLIGRLFDSSSCGEKETNADLAEEIETDS